MILEEKNENKLVYEIYDKLKDYPFIPKLKESKNGVDSIFINDGVNPSSLNKEKLISLTKALASIKRYGYAHNNLTLNNLYFVKDDLVAIKGFAGASRSNPLNDFLYVIDNYIDLLEEYYSEDYAIDLIITISEYYDKYTDDIDLGYELYWYFINILNKLDKNSDEYLKYDGKLKFVIKYKEYFDSLHQEEI